MNQRQGKPPDGFLHFLWLLRHWRAYWRELAGLALLLVLFWGISATGKYAIEALRSRFSSVTMRVIHFDHLTGETTLEFNNKKSSSVPVERVYITACPTNSAPMRPLPPEFQRMISVSNRSTLLVPSGASLEFGPATDRMKTKARLIRMAVLLVPDSRSLLLPPGLTLTNIAAKGSAFADICARFAPGAELEIVLHTSLTDAKGRSRLQNVRLGTYVVGDNHSGLIEIPHPRDVDVLRGGQPSGSASGRMVFTFTGQARFPHLSDDSFHFALLENSSPIDILATINEEIEGLVPIILIKNVISYGCQFSVDFMEGENFPRNAASWVLSRDGGKTVMSVPMAFSNSWSGLQSHPAPGQEYTIHLSSNDWQLLVNGERWARVVEGAVKYTVVQKAWLKLLEADAVTESLLSSSYNTIALQETKDDPSWVPIASPLLVTTNSKTALIVQNDILPDLSILSTLQMVDGSKDNKAFSQAATKAETLAGDVPKAGLEKSR